MLSLPLFTLAEIGGRALFRSVRLELWLGPGEGRVWMDVARGAVTPQWQRAVQNLADVGQRRFPSLPWKTTDLSLRAKGRDVTLDGRSASLPLFVAWTALLSGSPLPDPFFAAGVVEQGSEDLAPAPRDFAQGKLGVAQALAAQGGLGPRCQFHLPAGSDFDAARFPSLDVHQHARLGEAAAQILRLDLLAQSPRPGAAAGNGPAPGARP